MPTLDPGRIATVLAAITNEEPQRLGQFNPDRMPPLDIVRFDAVARLTAAVSPDCSYRLVQEALDQAASELLVYIYNISAGHLIDLLAQARDRNVTLCIMYDTTDTRGEERQKLQALGVELKAAPSSGRRQVFTVCHQKFVVVDRKMVLLGSANWAGTAIPKVPVPGKFRKGNREWLIAIADEPLARWFTQLFEADWSIPELEGPAGLAPAAEWSELGDVMLPAGLVAAPDEVFDLRRFDLPEGIAVTPLISPENYFDVMLGLIRAAQESIDVEQQYIKASGPKTRALLAALGQKHSDGVAVRIIVSPAFRKVGAVDSWEASVASLTQYGLAGCLRALNLEYFTHLHNKGVIVDRRQVVVSSTNWSENSIVQAREAGVLVESASVAEYFARVVDLDWRLSWDAADVPANLVRMAHEALFVPDGFERVHPADLA
jgi:phosphatidylserine/phosphatidylglycerophosphate/cardiolipin synthase-like enzyme